MPRSIAEVNAIRRSGQNLSASGAATQPSGIGHGRHGYDPSQPRVPAGHPDGGQWTDKPGAGGPGAPNRQVVLDEAEEAWESVTDTHRSDGTLSEQEVINRDGSRIVSQFSRAPRIAGWDERHTVSLPDGEQVAFESSGGLQTIYDADGQPIAANEWTSAGPEPLAHVQQVRFSPRAAPPARSAPATGPGASEGGSRLLAVIGSAAAALFSWLSRENSRDSVAVLAFKVGRFQKEEADENLSVEWVGRLTLDELKDVCKQIKDVQERTDAAVEKVLKDGKFKDAQDFGTKVHKMIEEDINNLNKPNYIAEPSLSKTKAEARYGDLDSIRVDILENLPKIRMVCIYDIKTGRKALYLPRMMELAETVRRKWNAVGFIVIEVRPTRR